MNSEAISGGGYLITAPVILGGGIGLPAVRSALRIAARNHGLTVEEAMEKSRRHRPAHCRQEAFTIASDWGLSLPKIARYFGFDHTTILHGIRAHRKRAAI